MKAEDIKSLQVGVLIGITLGMMGAAARPETTVELLPKPAPVIYEAEAVVALPGVDIEAEPEDAVAEYPGVKILEHEKPDYSEQIKDEIFYGEMELVAQLVRAEAGNQSYEGKRAVAGVVFNRVDSKDFPNTIEEVIFQKNQFSVIKDGAWDKAAWTVTEEDYQAVLDEWEERTYTGVLYFTAGDYGSYGTPAYKLGDHYFCRR